MSLFRYRSKVLEISKKKNRYRFTITSREGHPLLDSVEFDSEQDLQACIGQIRARIGNPASFERRTVHSGQFQFSLKDPSGRIVGQSALYRSEAGMENGIKNARSGFLESELT